MAKACPLHDQSMAKPDQITAKSRPIAVKSLPISGQSMAKALIANSQPNRDPILNKSQPIPGQMLAASQSQIQMTNLGEFPYKCSDQTLANSQPTNGQNPAHS